MKTVAMSRSRRERAMPILMPDGHVVAKFLCVLCCVVLCVVGWWLVAGGRSILLLCKNPASHILSAPMALSNHGTSESRNLPRHRVERVRASLPVPRRPRRPSRAVFVL